MRNNLRTTNRRCVLCDQIIPDERITCKEHWNYYLEHQNEEWMIELVNAQREQFVIDTQEFSLKTGRPIPEKRFLRKLTPDDRERVKYYYECGLGAVSIAKILKVNRHTVSKHIARFLHKRS
jgi:DNA-directed RNA polymerase specialized sigma24 family protein